MRLFFGYRFNDNASAAKESIELPAAARSALSLDHDHHFNKVRGGIPPPSGLLNSARKFPHGFR